MRQVQQGKILGHVCAGIADLLDMTVVDVLCGSQALLQLHEKKNSEKHLSLTFFFFKHWNHIRFYGYSWRQYTIFRGDSFNPFLTPIAFLLRWLRWQTSAYLGPPISVLPNSKFLSPGYTFSEAMYQVSKLNSKN